MNIIWKKPDNTLAVTSIFDGSDPIEHAKNLQKRMDIPSDWKVVATGIEDFPQDWPRQEDWRFLKNKIVVDMDCAKKSTKDRLRKERDQLLSALDIQSQINLENNADNSVVVAQKKRLRDITKLVDNCKTLEELKELSC